MGTNLPGSFGSFYLTTGVIIKGPFYAHSLPQSLAVPGAVGPAVGAAYSQKDGISFEGLSYQNFPLFPGLRTSTCINDSGSGTYNTSAIGC